jgi:hypothetical protein
LPDASWDAPASQGDVNEPGDAGASSPDAPSTGDATSPANDGASSSLSALSDTFGGMSLDPSWTVLHPEWVSVSVHDKPLYLQPNRSVLWYGSSQGILVYKLVTGNFKATATVHARLASNPALPPNANIHLGGVMARSPVSPPENYVFGVVGQAEMGHLAIEQKSTTNASSVFSETAWPSADADLRLCRVGSTFQIWKRTVATPPWVMQASFNRPDLPAELQVGPNCYANSTPPDLIAHFESIVFAGVSDLSQCSQD